MPNIRSDGNIHCAAKIPHGPLSQAAFLEGVERREKGEILRQSEEAAAE